MSVTEASLPEVKNYIGGDFKENGNKSMDVDSPLTGEKISS